MWFRTRVGLVSALEPMEIRVADYPEAKIPNYLVYAHSITEQEFKYKGLFGEAKAPKRYTYLAQFCVSDSAHAAIAECMKLIEEAIRTDAKVCDLSAVGDRDAWSKDWIQIEWQPKSAATRQPRRTKGAS